jgi:hypothetical protein
MSSVTVIAAAVIDPPHSGRERVGIDLPKRLSETESDSKEAADTKTIRIGPLCLGA